MNGLLPFLFFQKIAAVPMDNWSRLIDFPTPISLSLQCKWIRSSLQRSEHFHVAGTKAAFRAAEHILENFSGFQMAVSEAGYIHRGGLIHTSSPCLSISSPQSSKALFLSGQSGYSIDLKRDYMRREIQPEDKKETPLAHLHSHIPAAGRSLRPENMNLILSPIHRLPTLIRHCFRLPPSLERQVS